MGGFEAREGRRKGELKVSARKPFCSAILRYQQVIYRYTSRRTPASSGSPRAVLRETVKEGKAGGTDLEELLLRSLWQTRMLRSHSSHLGHLSLDKSLSSLSKAYSEMDTVWVSSGSEGWTDGKGRRRREGRARPNSPATSSRSRSI